MKKYSVKEPFISIIIPVYNTEKYLRKCLDSAVNQTFKDIEIIVVDDFSPGNCREIAESYNDSRIIYIRHELNRGALLSRKTGSIEARGKYITYLDSDDELDINMCQEIFNRYNNKYIDIIHFNTKSIIDKRENLTKEDKKNIKKVEWYMSSNRNLVNDKYLFEDTIEEKIPHNMWGKVYSNELIKKTLKYIPEIKLNMAEDMLQFLITSYFADNYSSIKNKFYLYKINTGNSNNNSILLTCEKYKKMCIDTINALNEFRIFLENMNIINLYSFYYCKLYNNQYNFLRNKIIDNENKNDYLSILNKYFDINIINNFLKLKKYKELSLEKEKKIISKLLPYFFSIIIYEYYINVRIFGIKINIKNTKCIKEPIVISLNNFLRNIFSINTNDERYIKILFIKMKLR